MTDKISDVTKEISVLSADTQECLPSSGMTESAVSIDTQMDLLLGLVRNLFENLGFAQRSVTKLVRNSFFCS